MYDVTVVTNDWQHEEEDNADVMVFDLRVNKELYGRPEIALASIQTYLNVIHPDFGTYIIQLEDLPVGSVRVIGLNPYTIEFDASELLEMVGRWGYVRFSDPGSSIYYRPPKEEERRELNRILELTIQKFESELR